MTLHVALTHRTSYRYDRPVALGPQIIRLRPAPHARTPIISYSLQIEPGAHFLNWQQDPQGNFLARVVVPERTTHFQVTVDLVADMATINPFDFFLEPEAETWPFTYDPVLEQELAPFRRLEPPGPKLTRCWPASRATSRRTIDMLVELNRVCRPDRLYRAHGAGHLVARGDADGGPRLLPRQRLAAGASAAPSRARRPLRLRLPDPAGRRRDAAGGPAGPTADFTDLHAWAEVYLPGAGWIGLDATSGLLTGEGHIPLAASPDPLSAAPISGGVEAAKWRSTWRCGDPGRETPRVTKPYTETQWQAILAAGARVDRALEDGAGAADDGRRAHLCQCHDIEGAEWTVDALGPTKRPIAGRLLRRLLPLVVAGRGHHHGLGKHYPGEQLPRWALSAHWRRTASRSGATRLAGRRRRRATPRGRMRRASAQRWPSGCRSRRQYQRRPTRTSTGSCGRSTGCRRTCWPRRAS